MKPIHSAALAATVMVSLHASAAAAQSTVDPALASTAVTSTAVPTPPTSLSVDEVARLHVAVTSLMTHPTPDALATIQEIRGLMMARLVRN